MVYASICTYKTLRKNVHNLRIWTLNLMHTARLSRPPDHECGYIQSILHGISLWVGILPARHLPADVERPAPAPPRPAPAGHDGPSRQPGPGLHLDLLDAQVCHGFVAGMWRRTLVWLRNMQQWESSESPVDRWPPHRPVGPQLKLWARAGTMQGEVGFPPLERRFMVCFQFNWVIVFLSPLYF